MGTYTNDEERFIKDLIFQGTLNASGIADKFTEAFPGKSKNTVIQKVSRLISGNTPSKPVAIREIITKPEQALKVKNNFITLSTNYKFKIPIDGMEIPAEGTLESHGDHFRIYLNQQ